MARQNFIGLVVSQGKMQKTVKVRVESKIFNKRINKEMFHRKDYLVHDEKEVSREGDLVRIEATRPLSKRKFFSIAEILRNKGQQFALFEAQAKEKVAKDETERSKEFLDRRAEKESGASTLLQDVLLLQQAYRDRNTETEDVREVRERYGVDELTPETVKQLLQLDISTMEADLRKQQAEFGEVISKVNDYMKDVEKANEYLMERGVQDPSSLKNNIKKNLLRKHILQERGL